jgi:hypothetical protein
MGLSIWVGKKRFEIGTPAFFKSFFSTVYVRVERLSWGSQFPVVMRSLYAGRVEPAEAPAARRELAEIRDHLRSYPPRDVVWDYERPEVNPPWGNDISPSITSLANYYVTSDGKDLIDVLDAALEAIGELATGADDR